MIQLKHLDRNSRSSLIPRAALLWLTWLSFLPLVWGATPAHPIIDALKKAEADTGAQIGFYLLDVDSRERLAYNADSRFPVNSTFKLFACAALLDKVEERGASLTEQIRLPQDDVVDWSPVVETWIEQGRGTASLSNLCEAMLAMSDNTAANLVLAAIGGPTGFTAFMRSLGDGETRLERWEPELNSGIPGDERDTSTPIAMGEALEHVLLGDTLNSNSNQQLKLWLAQHKVADELFRKVMPEGWEIEDRTGAGQHGTRGIIAVVYPPHRGPIVTTLFMRDAIVDVKERNRAIASIGNAIVTLFTAGRTIER